MALMLIRFIMWETWKATVTVSSQRSSNSVYLWSVFLKTMQYITKKQDIATILGEICETENIKQVHMKIF